MDVTIFLENRQGTTGLTDGQEKIRFFRKLVG